MITFVAILLAVIALMLFAIFGVLGNIKDELVKQTKQLDNNKVLVDVISELGK